MILTYIFRNSTCSSTCSSETVPAYLKNWASGIDNVRLLQPLFCNNRLPFVFCKHLYQPFATIFLADVTVMPRIRKGYTFPGLDFFCVGYLTDLLSSKFLIPCFQSYDYNYSTFGMHTSFPLCVNNLHILEHRVFLFSSLGGPQYTRRIG